MRFRVLIIILFIFMAVIPVFGEDIDSSGWDQIMRNGSSEGLRKPVTQKEFDNAMNTVEKIKKGKNKRNNSSDKMLNAEKPAIYQDDAIVRVYQEAFCKDYIVKAGFYNVKPAVEDQNYYIVMTQGGKIIAKINATKVNHSSFCKNDVKCVKMENIENKYLKFYYKDLDLALVGYLQVLEDEKNAEKKQNKDY
jgi:hypothetical protein